MSRGKRKNGKLKKLAAALFAGALLFAAGSALNVTSPEREASLPTADPTAAPTEAPTPSPTTAPTAVPAAVPTEAPTEAWTEAPTETPTEAPTPTPKPTPKPTATPKPTEEQSSGVTLVFAGDLMCLSAQQYAAQSQAGGHGYDFSPSFEYVKRIISGADFAMANLESTLSDSSPYAAQEPNIGGMPNCNGPKDFLAGVRYAGFDAVALANNHCCDAGLEGITDTISAVSEYGLKHTGLFRTQSERRYLLVTVKGVKIGILSYAEFFNGKDGPIHEAGCSYMLNLYSKKTMERDVAAARSAGAEFIIVFEHWGREHVAEPTELQRTHAQQMADAGVDIIVGSHSHCLQPTVWLTGRGGNRTLCMYSLGNFVSSMSRLEANDTALARIKIKRASGGVKIVGETYTPCRVIPTLNGKRFVVLPTSDTSFPQLRAELDAAERRITAVLFSER